MPNLCRSSECLEDLDRAQSFGFSIVKPELPVPNLSLNSHSTTRVVCVMNSVWPCLFDVGICIVERVFIDKQPRQVVMIPKQLIAMPVEGSCDPNSRLEMVNRPLPLSPGTIYRAESPMKSTEGVFFAFFWEEIDRVRCGVFCVVQLSPGKEQTSKDVQTLGLLNRVPESFVNFQRFLQLLYPFIMESQPSIDLS